MKAIRPGLALLLVQLALVLSVAGKYLYERHTRPRVWTRATQFDPNLPLRGRYLAMQLVLDACALPRDAAIRPLPNRPSFRQWDVSLGASNGKLVPTVEKAWSPRRIGTLTLEDDRLCDHATLSSQQLLFISDRAQLPLPLKPGQELWVEVTVPSSGPPRPIQIALSSAEGFQPLKMD
jgi:hypothetical protein